jgi:hypothetical protein
MTIFKALLLVAVLALAGSGAFIYSGTFNIAADVPHWTITHRLITTLRDRSIAANVRGIEMPADLGDPERARRGAGNFDAMCTGCHLAPGLEDSEIRAGLYPQPPNLSKPGDGDDAGTLSAARQFWVIKHGLKMSGMPAWGKAGVDDATIWDIVALLSKLSSLTADEYRDLVESSAGHSHAGAHMRGHDMQTAPADTAPAGHRDAPGTPPHSHGGATAVENKHEDDGHRH